MHNHSKIGGILSLVCAGMSLLSALGMLALIIFFLFIFQMIMDTVTPFEDYAILVGVYGTTAVFFVILGVLGIVGGVFALRKRHWGLALAAAIAGTLSFFPCGVIAIVFTSMAKDEFKSQSPVNPIQYPYSPGN